MRVDDAVKRDVLARADLVELIGAYVVLRKTRNDDFIGLCPFHAEKTPSFHVHPERGFWKCFGCGKGGDAITFLREHDALGFMDALRVLAKRVGVELEPESPGAARARGEKEAIYHANDVAAAFWHRMLVQDPSGAAARAYCERRGITAATINAFRLGFAPDSWDALAQALRAEGVPPEIGVKAGLLKPGARTPYDFYRDRLMVPTRATTGETIAFGGRALGDAEPKYLNTATTPVYEKGRHLFALDIARRSAAKDGATIVVEGYLDCIALHQAGFTNAVAALGTAFTPQQARELARVAPRVYLCYDMDAAGRNATLKTLDILAAEGVETWILSIPDGKDPDDLVRAGGPEAFAAILATPISATQFKLDARLGEGDPHRDGTRDRTALARWAEQTLRSLAPREEWDRWRVYVAGRLGLDADDLRKSRLLVASPATTRPGATVNASGHHVPGSGDRPTFEREALAAVLEEPALLEEYASRIPAERFVTPYYRAMWERLVAARGSLVQPSDLYALFSEDDEASAALASIASAVRFFTPDARREKLDAVVARFARDDAALRYRDLGRTIDRLFESGEPVPGELRDEHRRLAAELKG